MNIIDSLEWEETNGLRPSGETQRVFEIAGQKIVSLHSEVYNNDGLDASPPGIEASCCSGYSRGNSTGSSTTAASSSPLLVPDRTDRGPFRQFCAGMFFATRNGTSSDSVPVLLYFHGNFETVGQQLSDMLQRMANVFGMHILAVDYPGYGLTPNPHGRMSIGVDSINAVADASFWFLVNELSFPPERIIVGGFSIGTGVAASLVHRLWHRHFIKVAGLFLQSPYTKLSSLATEFVEENLGCAKNFCMLDKLAVPPKQVVSWDVIRLVSECPIPVMVLHPRDDMIISVSHGMRVAANSGAPSDKVVAVFPPFGGHGHLWTSPSVAPYLRTFLVTCGFRRPSERPVTKSDGRTRSRPPQLLSTDQLLTLHRSRMACEWAEEDATISLSLRSGAWGSMYRKREMEKAGLAPINAEATMKKMYDQVIGRQLERQKRILDAEKRESTLMEPEGDALEMQKKRKKEVPFSLVLAVVEGVIVNIPVAQVEIDPCHLNQGNDYTVTVANDRGLGRAMRMQKLRRITEQADEDCPAKRGGDNK
ncbi:hypothetical protein FOL47_007792 [Perkinsus chesapeaki]|uniref:Alpha/beta hydrolase fold-3 domain-containing protein n=1 Tax=Perkinsus chesapeaki TaxID=330153 RepID=A0A7J6LHX3_PERCH|nr:hypothetical protein FOL47_007792 [Perkinsus chesapeaki]